MTMMERRRVLMGVSREDWLKGLNCVYEPDGAHNTGGITLNLPIYVNDRNRSRISADLTVSAIGSENPNTGFVLSNGSGNGGQWIGIVNGDSFGLSTSDYLPTGLDKQTLHIAFGSNALSVSSGDHTVSRNYVNFVNGSLCLFGLGSSYFSKVRFFEGKIFYDNELIAEILPVRKANSTIGIATRILAIIPAVLD